jgi:hypothetical protein
MKTNKLIKKYSTKELADSFVFRRKLTPKQEAETNKKLSELREKNKTKLTEEQILLSRLLQLKYQMEDYSNNFSFDINRTFGYFLREYVKFLNKKNKDFAKDLSIDETYLSQVINRHRMPNDELIIRLEIHSSKIIPAVAWYKIMEKEREYEIATDTSMRKKEQKYVKNSLNFSSLIK